MGESFIEHENSTTSLYAHQQEYQVNVGGKVEQDQVIGYVGSIGNSISVKDPNGYFK